MDNPVKELAYINLKFEEKVRNMLSVYHGIQSKLPCKLGGSLALYLHGVLGPREFKDIDVIMLSKDYEKYRTTLQETETGVEFSQDARHKERIEGVDVDFFTGESGSFVNITFEGVTYRVTTLREIMEARLKYGLNHNHFPETLKICSRAVVEITDWQRGSWNSLSKPRSCF